jgi:hypothetical protein
MKRFIGSMCVVLLLAFAANAAQINFEFGSIDGAPLPRGTLDIQLDPCQTATINVYLTLEESGFPPAPEEMGMLTYVLGCYEIPPGAFVPFPTDVEIIGYSNDLVDYSYTNVPGGGGAFNFTEILYNTGTIVGPGEYLVSDIIIHCTGPSEDYFMIQDPGTDILLYKPDLLTSIPFTLGTGSTAVPLHLIQTPEPATIGLLGLGGLALLRRRR